MLDNIRKFSKTFLAKIILVIIIIPFVFWGMGGVFNSGNTNSLAKINNINVSTQDFIEYLNESKINQDIVRDNLDNNILEQLLTQLISMKILEMEIKDLNIKISDKDLAIKIKNNENFQDDNKKFSRVKYEKFLLSNNLTATDFEKGFKKTFLQQQLFSYIGAGISSPTFFTNKQFKKETKKINVEYINLEKIYKSKSEFTNNEINNFVEQNKDQLKKDFIDFSYVKIDPKSLVGLDEYDKAFFDKIDEIDNKLSNGFTLNDITNEYNLIKKKINNFTPINDDKNIENMIYKMRNQTKVSLIDQNEYYLLFEIENINTKLPDLTNLNFMNEIKEKLYNKEKYNFNKELINQINDNDFNYQKFKDIVNNELNRIQKTTINSIEDDKIFTLDSINIIYSIPINSFLLGSDDNNNVFIIRILDETVTDISKDNEKYDNYKKKSVNNVKNEILASYDYYLNSKYEIKINEKTLERVKNYFK